MVVKFKIEVYIIDNLKANIFINISIFKIYRILLNLETQKITIIYYNNIKILIYYIAKLYSQLY